MPNPLKNVGIASLVAISGFLNLSYELLWVRAYSFSIKGAGPAFALLLGTYLIGLAFGSLAVTKITESHGTSDDRSLRAVAMFIGIGNVVGYLALPAMAWIAVTLDGPDLTWMLLPTLFASTFLGTHFPLLTHYGVKADADAGFNVAWLYISNIIGSCIGSLVTGFYLMDSFGLADNAIGLSVVAMFIALGVYLSGRPSKSQMAAGIVATLIAVGGMLAGHDALFDRFYDKLLFFSHWESEPHITTNIENRSGVISITEDGRIFGGGVYDGDFSVDLVNDKNGIIRPFALSAFHPAPKRVLVGGLGSGSWARVIAEHPQVEEVIVVEINDGYQEAIKGTVGESILTHPKVTHVNDDLRRYLRLHGRKFDALVFNMTFNWRAMASVVLSVEFFEIVQQHLHDDGVIIVNATGNPRVFRAALAVFGEVNRVANAVVATPTKFDFDPLRLKRTLLSYQVEGKPVLDLSNSADRTKLERILKMFEVTRVQDTLDNFDWQNHETLMVQTEGIEPITDDNTGDEFRGF